MIGLYAVWGLISSGAANWEAVASHVFLYKMFDNELDISLCYPFWFISTIIQFYIFFPLIMRLIRIRGGVFACAADKHFVGYFSRMVRI